MKQSRLETLLETTAGLVIGFIGSVIITQYVVNPLWSLNINVADSMGITVVFTVWTFIRT